MKKDDDPLSVDEETANKMTFIIESGLRMHTTDYDWPKSHAPSGFATKLRKFIRNKRIEDIKQVGIDRLIDIQFGSKQAANHLIIELYDRGNLVLTDDSYCILAILRWRKPTEKTTQPPQGATMPSDSEEFKVGQTYPLDRCRKAEDLENLDEHKIIELLNNAKTLLGMNQNYKKRNKAKPENNDGTVEINLKDLLNPYVIYGSSLLEDKLLNHLSMDNRNMKKCVIRIASDSCGSLDRESVSRYSKLIRKALDDADVTLREVQARHQSPGYIVQKRLSNPRKDLLLKEDELDKDLTTNIDFYPLLSCAERRIQQEPGSLTYQVFDSFDKAVDSYYCNLESQRIDSKAFSAQKEVTKKLENLKIAREKRIEELVKAQENDEEKARLIELNSDRVEEALSIIRSMLANQMPWSDIWSTIREAQARADPLASLITAIKFDRNEFTMKLSDPYESTTVMTPGKFREVDIDISLSAFANARRFFVKRRAAVNKEKKTIEVSKKAYKNVERKTKAMLKEVVVKTNITRARKRYWFENFFWFLSSDGYLVVAGRDAEQNELLVKRYMKNNDIYVHADLHGASTVIIKNEFTEPVPPKTLVEAGNMAVCYSSAWDSKIATTSWWVYPKQVSKTAPAGEYLTTGAFIIRGKKNFLPLSNLVLGFGFLFRLEEESVERRKAERVRRELERSRNPPANRNMSSDEEEVTDDDQQSIGSVSSLEDDLNSKDSKLSRSEPEIMASQSVADDFDDQDEVEDDYKVTEHRLVDTLSDAPGSEDVLLYAIPMCGPYSAFQSFKFKVKVVPGANKRGKAAKACLGMFLHDKRASQREKDLLRALKDQDYARNIPNKVKISAANMKTYMKKRPKKSEVRLPIT